MTDTFNGTTIYVLTPSAEYPVVEYEPLVNVRHVPGGNINYIDTGGLGVGKLRVPLRFTNYAAYVAMAALLGTSATLVYNGATFSALLSSLSNARQLDGSIAYVVANAEFVI